MTRLEDLKRNFERVRSGSELTGVSREEKQLTAKLVALVNASFNKLGQKPKQAQATTIKLLRNYAVELTADIKRNKVALETTVSTADKKALGELIARREAELEEVKTLEAAMESFAKNGNEPVNLMQLKDMQEAVAKEVAGTRKFTRSWEEFKDSVEPATPADLEEIDSLLQQSDKLTADQIERLEVLTARVGKAYDAAKTSENAEQITALQLKQRQAEAKRAD